MWIFYDFGYFLHPGSGSWIKQIRIRITGFINSSISWISCNNVTYNYNKWCMCTKNDINTFPWKSVHLGDSWSPCNCYFTLLNFTDFLESKNCNWMGNICRNIRKPVVSGNPTLQPDYAITGSLKIMICFYPAR